MVYLPKKGKATFRSLPLNTCFAITARLCGPKDCGAIGHVAEWLRSGLQIRVRGFDSLRGLQLPTRCKGGP